MVMPKPHYLFTTTTKNCRHLRLYFAGSIANKLKYEHACMILVFSQGSALPDLGSLPGPRPYSQKRLLPKACPRWILDWHCSCRYLLISNQLAPILPIERHLKVKWRWLHLPMLRFAICSEIYSSIIHQKKVLQAKTKITSESLGDQV